MGNLTHQNLKRINIDSSGSRVSPVRRVTSPVKKKASPEKNLDLTRYREKYSTNNPGEDKHKTIEDKCVKFEIDGNGVTNWEG